MKSPSHQSNPARIAWPLTVWQNSNHWDLCKQECWTQMVRAWRYWDTMAHMSCRFTCHVMAKLFWFTCKNYGPDPRPSTRNERQLGFFFREHLTLAQEHESQIQECDAKEHQCFLPHIFYYYYYFLILCTALDPRGQHFMLRSFRLVWWKDRWLSLFLGSVVFFLGFKWYQCWSYCRPRLHLQILVTEVDLDIPKGNVAGEDMVLFQPRSARCGSW